MTLSKKVNDIAREIARAEVFSGFLYEGLEKEYWGMIEPGVFGNISEGLTEGAVMTDADKNKLHYDKISREEAATEAENMFHIVVEALKRLDAWQKDNK